MTPKPGFIYRRKDADLQVKVTAYDPEGYVDYEFLYSGMPNRGRIELFELYYELDFNWLFEQELESL